jgi:tetratricopeptide (TPR) repeat protein
MSEKIIEIKDIQELEKMKEAYKTAPYNIDVASKLAQYYADRGMLDEGIKIYKNLSEIYPDDYSILLAYGNICYSNKNIQESLDIFKKITVLKPKRVEGWNNLGIIQLALEDYESAKKSFSVVLELEPENHGAFLNMGNYYDYVGNVDKAIEMFKHAVAFRPGFVDGWYNLGNAYLKIEEFEKAVDAFNKSLKYNRKFYSACKNIGFAYEEMGEFKKAEEYYFKAMGLDKADHTLYVNIATVYTKQLEYDKAKDFYLRAVKLAPKDPAGWLGLRKLSLEKGDIKVYVKSTLAVLHRLDSMQITESLKKLRQLELYEDIYVILESAEEFEKEGDELDAEAMLAYMHSKKDKSKASLLYKKVQGVLNPSDHVLYCLAVYCMNEHNYDAAVRYLQSIKHNDMYSAKLLWAAHIEKKEVDSAEGLIEEYLLDNHDCFEAWYQLAKIKAIKKQKKEAQEYLLRAIETGFTDFDMLDGENELKKIYKSIS